MQFSDWSANRPGHPEQSGGSWTSWEEGLIPSEANDLFPLPISGSTVRVFSGWFDFLWMAVLTAFHGIIFPHSSSHDVPCVPSLSKLGRYSFWCVILILILKFRICYIIAFPLPLSNDDGQTPSSLTWKLKKRRVVHIC
jgi:hypothetical protein